MDRRRFLALGAGMPVLGALLLNKPTILEGEAPALSTQGRFVNTNEPTHLYVPEQPTILKATDIKAPFIESSMLVRNWSIDMTSDRVNIHNFRDPSMSYIGLPRNYTINITAEATDLSFMGDNHMDGRKVRMYLVDED